MTGSHSCRVERSLSPAQLAQLERAIKFALDLP